MNKRKQLIKKIVVLAIWCMVGVSTLVLLVAANRHQGDALCANVAVKMNQDQQTAHMQTREILEMISNGDPESLTKMPLNSFNLVQLESLLEQHLWIRNAELYFDNLNALHVEIEERRPVARVFTRDGESFYLDEKGLRLPVSINQIAYVPVFTGFPLAAESGEPSDSLLQQEIIAVGDYLVQNDQWMKVIDQIYWDTLGMQMLPASGKFEIRFGEGKKVAQKFKRLQLFYEQILSRTGFDYYLLLDLRYDKQLVAFKADSMHLLSTYSASSDTMQKMPDIADSAVASKAPVKTKPKAILPILKQ